ncbi:hypothetical protein ACWGSK_15060 [Nocardiopsis sp. NPDC055551]
MFFELDENGRTRPMSPDALRALAKAAFKEDPENLAAEYLDWHMGSRIEWLRFVSRFSAAVFAYRATQQVSAERVEAAQKELRERDGWSQEWAGELETVVTERLGFLEDSVRIAASAAILAATAAVELLIAELTDDPDGSGGGLALRLGKLLEAFEHDSATAEELQAISGRVRALRNSLAHRLDGSDWASTQDRPDLTGEGIERAFRDVGRLATGICAIVEPRKHDRILGLFSGVRLREQDEGAGEEPQAPEAGE